MNTCERYLTRARHIEVQIVGDDHYVTNTSRIMRGIEEKTANALLVKVNQIGSLTDMAEAVEAAHRAGFKTMMSHRSGETEDSTIADLGAWAASGSGTSLLSDGLIEQRLTTRKTVEGLDYGLGIIDFGNGWIGHSGQLIGWEALVLYDTDTGDVAVSIVNETSSILGAEIAIATIFPYYGETLGF